MASRVPTTAPSVRSCGGFDRVSGVVASLVLTGSVGQDTRFAVRNQQYAVVLNTVGLGTKRNLLDR